MEIWHLICLCSISYVPRKLTKFKEWRRLKLSLTMEVWRYLSQWWKQYVATKFRMFANGMLVKLQSWSKNCHQHSGLICRWWIPSPTSVHFQDLVVDESTNTPNFPTLLFSPICILSQFTTPTVDDPTRYNS